MSIAIFTPPYTIKSRRLRNATSLINTAFLRLPATIAMASFAIRNCLRIAKSAFT